MGEVFLIEWPANKCIVFFILLHRTAFPEAAKRSKARTPELVGFIHARVHILHRDGGNYRRLISRSRLVAVSADLHVDLHVDINVDLHVFEC